MPREPVVRTPFTDRDKAMIRALSPDRVSYVAAGSPKRFARSLNDILRHQPDLGMTNKQRAFMADIAYRYRRQLPKALAPPTPPSFDEIAPLMTDDELMDALGVKQEMEPDAGEQNPQDEALRDESEPKANVRGQNRTCGSQERLL